MKNKNSFFFKDLALFKYKQYIMSKVKVKKIKQLVGDVDINSMFEEMMGVKDAEPDIIIPKIVNVRNIIRLLYKIFNQFSTFVDLRNNFPQIGSDLDDIKKFAEDMKESVCIINISDENEEPYKTVSKEEINNIYRKLKENQYVKNIIILCNKLDKYKANFSDPNNFKENFVNQEPGLSFKIFNFSGLDLKILWAHDNMKSSVKKYILTVLSKMHTHSHNLYKIITSPDIDIEKFTDVLINSISELKKQPELHRCKMAFGRIEQSVQLLKDKFGDYYRESVASENPNALITSFIVDVSNQGGADARLTREFRTIIQYMHKVSQRNGKNKDPNVQKIFKMLNHNYSLMEQHTSAGDGAPIIPEENDIDNLDLTIIEEKKEKPVGKNTKKKTKHTVSTDINHTNLNEQQLAQQQLAQQQLLQEQEIDEIVNSIENIHIKKD